MTRTIVGEGPPAAPQPFDLSPTMPFPLTAGSTLLSSSWGGRGAILASTPGFPALLVATEQLKPALIHKLLAADAILAVADRADEVIVAVAGRELGKAGVGAEPGARGVVRLVRMVPERAPRNTLVYTTDNPVSAPAIAVAASGAVVAFREGPRLLVAIVGPEGAPRGPAIEVARGDLGPPAIVALAESTIVVWTERDRPEAPFRLRGATLPAGATSFDPPRDLGPANVAPSSLTLVAVGEDAALSWLDLAPAPPTIRFARLTNGPVLTPPLDVGPGAPATAPRVAVTTGGAWIAWAEGERVRGARVLCR